MKHLGLNMRYLISFLVLSFLAGCSSFGQSGPVQAVDNTSLIAYSNYCAVPFDGNRSAASVAASGFASVEQQCGNFFDKLSELTQTGRFGAEALTAASLGTQTIMQAAKTAARSVTIVGAAYTVSEAVLNSFIQQYAFSPYLYKIRELVWQGFTKHTTDSATKLAQLKSGFLADDYCDAAILIQQHASLCTISSIQSFFDQQVANATVVVKASDKSSDNNGHAVAASRATFQTRLLTRTVPPANAYIPITPPNYTVQ